MDSKQGISIQNVMELRIPSLSLKKKVALSLYKVLKMVSLLLTNLNMKSLVSIQIHFPIPNSFEVKPPKILLFLLKCQSNNRRFYHIMNGNHLPFIHLWKLGTSIPTSDQQEIWNRVLSNCSFRCLLQTLLPQESVTRSTTDCLVHNTICCWLIQLHFLVWLDLLCILWIKSSRLKSTLFLMSPY